MLCYAAIIFCLIYHSEGKHKEPQGLDAFPAIRDVVGRMYAEIHAGKIKRTVPPVGEHEWMTILAGPMAQPSPGGKPAYDLDDPAKLASLVKGRLDRLSAEAFAVEYRSYPLISGAGCSGKPIRLWRWNSDSARRCWHQSATLRSL